LPFEKKHQKQVFLPQALPEFKKFKIVILSYNTTQHCILVSVDFVRRISVYLWEKPPSFLYLCLPIEKKHQKHVSLPQALLECQKIQNSYSKFLHNTALHSG
jgi:hypothetical protein